MGEGEKKGTVWKCPHCGEPIVGGEYVLVPLDNYNKLMDSVGVGYTVDCSRKKLRKMVDRLTIEVAKVHAGLKSVGDGIENAGQCLYRRWEEEWPYKEKPAATPTQYALPLSVQTIRRKTDNSIMTCMVFDAHWKQVGPTFATEEEAMALLERVEKNGGRL